MVKKDIYGSAEPSTVSPVDPSSTRTGRAHTEDSEAASDRRLSRRALCATVGTAALGGLAGCNLLGPSTPTAPLFSGDWYSFGNGMANTNYVPGGLPEVTESDILQPARWLYAPPVVYDGVVYFVGSRRITAVTPAGDIQWERRLEAELTGVPAVDQAREQLYVSVERSPPDGDTSADRAGVAVLSLGSGDIINTVSVGGEHTYGVTPAGNDIYARSATSCVRIAPDGTERWRQSLQPLQYDEINLGDSTATQIAPAVTDDAVYVPGQDSLVKLDRDTGQEQWRVRVEHAYAASVIDDAGVIQTGWEEIVAVDHTGTVRWRRDLQSRAAAATAPNGDIYVIANDLHELDPATGETTWQTHLSSEGTAAPIVTADSVLVVDGNLRVFRRTTDLGPLASRTRWELSSVHAVEYSSPVVANGHIFVSGPAGLIAVQPGQDG